MEVFYVFFCMKKQDIPVTIPVKNTEPVFIPVSGTGTGIPVRKKMNRYRYTGIAKTRTGTGTGTQKSNRYASSSDSVRDSVIPSRPILEE